MTILEFRELIAALKLNMDLEGFGADNEYRIKVNNMLSFVEKKLDSDENISKEDVTTAFEHFNIVREAMRTLAPEKVKAADGMIRTIENAFASLDVDKEQTLSAHIEKANMNNIKLENAPISMGAASSQRHMITLPYGANKKVDGFFTAETKLFDFDKDKKVENMLIEAMWDEKNQDNKLLQDVCEHILSSKYGANLLMMGMAYNKRVAYDPSNTDISAAYSLNALNLMNILGMKLDKDNKNNVMKFFANVPLVELMLKIRALYTDDEVKEFEREAEQYTHLAVEAEVGSALAGRNVAMTNVANLLGVPNVVAKSQTATASWEGKHIQGVFTEKVEGSIPPAEGKEDDYSYSDFWYIKDDTSMDGDCLKSMAELQILDYICGNVDRHQNNFAYQIGKDGKMKGIQGFDNDLSFGTKIPGDEDGIHNGIALDNITVISESMAKRVMEIDEKTLRAALDGNGLKEAEIDACVERLNRVKNHITEGLGEAAIDLGIIKIVKDEEWAGMKLDTLADKCGVYEDNSPMANIFGLARIIRDEVIVQKNKKKNIESPRKMNDRVKRRLGLGGFERGTQVDAMSVQSFGEKLDRLKKFAEDLAGAKKLFSGKSPQYDELEKAVAKATGYDPEDVLEEAMRDAFEKDLQDIYDKAEAYIEYKNNEPKKDTGEIGQRRVALAAELKSYADQELVVFKTESVAQLDKELAENAQTVKEENAQLSKIVEALAKEAIKDQENGDLEKAKAEIGKSKAFRMMIDGKLDRLAEYSTMADNEPGALYTSFNTFKASAAKASEVDTATRGRFDSFIDRLNAASNLKNSEPYNDLIKAVKYANTHERLGKKDTLDDAHSCAVKLWAIKDQIIKYLDLKAKEGIKQNSFEKLVVIEELNKEVTARLGKLNLPNFRYKDNTIYSRNMAVTYKEEAKKYKKNFDMETLPESLSEKSADKFYNKALENYPNVKREDMVSADDCMLRIMLHAIHQDVPEKQMKHLEEMRRQFLLNPNKTIETRQAGQEAVQANPVVRRNNV